MSDAIRQLRKFLGDEPDTLVRMLARAEQQLTKRSLAQLHATSHAKLTTAQLQVIRQLCFGNARTTEIANGLGITKQAVSQLLGPLLREGLIEQIPDPADGRAKINHLTAEGNAIFDELLLHTISVEQKLRDKLGASKMADLKSLLNDLVEETPPS